METPVARIENLSHRYTEAQWAIRDINFEIYKSGIVGLLGPNGAGKSTTMKILCGILNQTDGDVYIDNIDVNEKPREAKKILGYLPQDPPLYEDLTVDEYLIHCAHLRSVKYKNIPTALAEAKRWCGIDRFSDRLIGNLSGGYQQRTGLAQAIIHKPKLLILDEPTTGLDPNQISEVRDLIRELAEDRTILLSTHILSEAKAMCEDIVMLNEGEVVFSDSVQAFENYIKPSTIFAVMTQYPGKKDLLNVDGITEVERISENNYRLHFEGDEDITQEVIKASVDGDWDLREIHLEKNSLDTVFAQLSNSN